ncbi:MAG: Rieske 2Fe-2S domain-containing protein, partial [Chloroflexi bacterium]|nr:Rieske 2Fe-2S domain-containing protein [Chloroflexota bacterium]
MLTQEENDLLTRIGPGTPAGAVLRMYWHPISLARDVDDEHPTKFVRILGEDLVIFRDKSGRHGLLADHCSHRGASLLYGRVEERGISCAYHGWLYDCEGNILETPPERNDAIMKSVKHTAYPVQVYLGMIWAYMGPLPAPPMVHYDTLFRKDGTRKWLIHPQLNANWFQAMENSMDPAHLQILHQEFIGRGRTPPSTTRGFTDDVESYEFYVTDYGGLIKKRTYVNGMVDEHPVLFPNILRQGASSQFRVPIDDTHTLHMRLFFYPTEDGSEPEDAFEPEITFEDPIKEDPEKSHPETRFILHSV